MRPPIARGILAAVLAILVAGSAHAIVDVSTPDNSTPIGVDPTWAGGDPGWTSVTSSGANYTYLGDSWILAIGNYTGLPAHFSTGTFAPIPNQVFVVPNPVGWPQGLSLESDLRLIRINGNPNVPAVTLATEPPPLGGEVVFIGQGRGRAAAQTNWDVNKANPDSWAWAEVPSEGDYHGYKAAGSTVKRWGTNTIADEDPVFDEDDADLNRIVTRSDRDTVSLITTFDQLGATHESQTIFGDVGSAVFYDHDGQWELAGVVTDVLPGLIYPGQSATWAVFGNVAALADMSVYRDEITGIINSHRGYSVMGDVNLDGSIWDGAGDPAADPDIAAFLDGWMAYDYGTGQGDIASWQQGDMNLDGTTDVDDFLLLREALNSVGSGSIVSSPGTGTATVPESTSAVLGLLGAALAIGRLRRRRRSCALSAPAVSR
jgi:hypothetical protein